MILKKGSQEVKTKDSVIRNIATAAKAIGLTFYRGLGPNGMNIFVCDEKGDTFYAHDAYTALQAIRNSMSHPVARLIHEAVKTIDDNVGDGGKIFCILLGEAMKNAEKLREEGVRTANIIAGYSAAIKKSIELLDSLAINVDESKLFHLIQHVVHRLPLSNIERDTITDLVIEAIKYVTADGSEFDPYFVKVKNKLGGDVSGSFLVKGVVIDKIWPGYIQMPQYVESPKIALLTSPIEIKKTSLKYEYVVSPKDVNGLKNVRDGVSEFYKSAVRHIVSTGAKVVLSRKELHDEVLEGLSREGVISAYRFNDEEILFLSRATGARPVHNHELLTSADLGEADIARQFKIGNERWILIEGCKRGSACTIVLRGNSFKALKMYEKAVTKSLRVARSFLLDRRVLPGGGATELYISQRLKEWAHNLQDQKSLPVLKMADCFEKIPYLLALNTGKDPWELLTRLRSLHFRGYPTYGIDSSGVLDDMVEKGVITPVKVVENILKILDEVLQQLLRVENVVIARQIKGNVTTR